jgi:hydroxymethylpyrimidine pyrophosphatase-like HAD family hydrolase
VASPSVALKRLLAAHGLECVTSAGRYLDILPAGVSKGSTLLKLIERTGHDRQRVLVCGDSLNDLSMFDTGLRGVVVANAEASLLAATARCPRTFQSASPGVGGIIDALMHFGIA